MPVEKGKVKAALDAKYKGTSLTKELKEGYADAFAATIEDDESIEAFLNTQDALIRLNMKDADRRSQAAAAKARQEAADAAAGKKPEDVKPEDVEDPTEPAWAKALRKQNEELHSRLEGFQRQQSTQTISEQIKQDERTKAIPAAFYKGRALPTAETYEAFVEELKADYTTFATENNLQGFGAAAPPAGNGFTAAAGQTGKVDADLMAFAKQKQDAALQTKN